MTAPRHPLTGYPAFRPHEEIERLLTLLRERLEASVKDLAMIVQLGTERDTAIAHLDDADKENERLREELQQSIDYADGIAKETAEMCDETWKETLLKRNPKYGDWEYEGFFHRHLRVDYEMLLKQRDTFRTRLSAIREIAEDWEDGAPDADPREKALNRIAAIAAGEGVP